MKPLEIGVLSGAIYLIYISNSEDHGNFSGTRARQHMGLHDYLDALSLANRLEI